MAIEMNHMNMPCVFNKGRAQKQSQWVWVNFWGEFLLHENRNPNNLNNVIFIGGSMISGVFSLSSSSFVVSIVSNSIIT